MALTPDTSLVAACGLYCGACRSHLRGKCPGCRNNTKATWCKVRSCNHSHGYATCAECKDFADPMQCKMYNNAMSKIFGFIFRSNRAACIAQIKTIGLEGHAKMMAEAAHHTIRK